MSKLAHTIKSLTPLHVRKSIWRIGEYFGIELDNPDQFPSLAGSIATLQKLGLTPHFCVDVGAYRGEWTSWFKVKFPSTKILMIEAQENQRAKLGEIQARHPQDIHLEIALLGPQNGAPVVFNEMETGSSVFAEASSYTRTRVQKRTKTLDSVLATRKFPPVDFLKLDVQGYELEVLKGAARALSQAHVVLLEASLIPVNQGCPLIAEVLGFMAARRFRLFDFCSQTRRLDGVLWQTDLIFVREGSALLPKPELSPENWR